MFNCDAPLGMENGNIRDDQISAKSSLSISKGPLKSRLRSNGTWCPKNQVHQYFISLASYVIAAMFDEFDECSRVLL